MSRKGKMNRNLRVNSACRLFALPVNQVLINQRRAFFPAWLTNLHLADEKKFSQILIVIQYALFFSEPLLSKSYSFRFLLIWLYIYI